MSEMKSLETTILKFKDEHKEISEKLYELA